MRRSLFKLSREIVPSVGQGERRTPLGPGTLRQLHSCSALVYRQHGHHHDTVRMEEMSLAALGQHSVRLRMLAAPVNPADINMLQGTYPILPRLPAVGGNEGLGEVIEVGTAVTSLRPGDWAIPWDAGFGTWRTEAVCEAGDLLRIPRDMPLLGAATIGVNPCTAYRMLHDFVTLTPGATVIQNGANSAVGQAVIQIAAALGVKTINVIRDRPYRRELEEELKSMGADLVITEEELQGLSLENVIQGLQKPVLGLNCVGGQSGGLVLSSLCEGGTLVTYGGMAKKPLHIPAKALIFRNITLQGFWMTQWKRNNSQDMSRLQAMVTSVCGLMKSGQLRSPQCVQVPFHKYSRALYATTQSHQRKHVLIM
ncbi:enoyl-[acyl-carrier-protein] reductase, mitochondrial [Esox lucius]|nr:enoyl-[acyl-carrier-protein] reductase, mitochondrial [Esox lucius]